MAEPRIAPLQPPYTDEVGAVLEAMVPPGIEPIGLFRTFARNLPMAEAMRGWGGYELGRSLAVSRREREVVILRACARCRCDYEWGVHVAFFAERVGLTPAQVEATATEGPGWAGWSGNDALLVRFVDELHDSAQVGDELWAELSAAFDDNDAALLDLLALAGWYRAIAYLANGARVAPESWAPALPAVDSSGRSPR